MKFAWQALIFWIFINGSVGMLYSLGVPPFYTEVNSVDLEEVADLMDPNATIQGWVGDATDYEIGDPVRGISKLWTTIVMYVAGLPTVLASWGVPAPIILMLFAGWMITWGAFGYEFITGRIFSDD